MALLQALVAGIILHAAGIPGAGLIAFGVLFSCIVQIAPAPILLPVARLGMGDPATGFALVLTLLLVPVSLVDNVAEADPDGRRLITPMLVT